MVKRNSCRGSHLRFKSTKRQFLVEIEESIVNCEEKYPPKFTLRRFLFLVVRASRPQSCDKKATTCERITMLSPSNLFSSSRGDADIMEDCDEKNETNTDLVKCGYNLHLQTLRS
jgi:hypothetical protein